MDAFGSLGGLRVRVFRVYRVGLGFLGFIGVGLGFLGFVRSVGSRPLLGQP